MYKAISGQSIYDICLMTYGTFDLLFKLVSDNLNSINDTIISGQNFVWDSSITVNSTINNVTFATL